MPLLSRVFTLTAEIILKVVPGRIRKHVLSKLLSFMSLEIIFFTFVTITVYEAVGNSFVCMLVVFALFLYFFVCYLCITKLFVYFNYN